MTGIQQPIRLAHITTIPSTLLFLTGQVEHMRSKGFQIHTLSSPGEIPVDVAGEIYRHHTVKMTRRMTPGRDLAALVGLTRHLRRIRPAIVHSHTPKAGLLGMLAAWIARVPVRIYHIHGLPFVTATGNKRRILAMTERIACKLANQVLCVSPSVRDVVVSERFCPVNKIKVLGSGSINGVDAKVTFNPTLTHGIRCQVRAKYNIPQDAVVIGFVGRIVRDKGIAELAEAWHSIRYEFPEAYLMMVGDFEEEDAISGSTQRVLRTDDRVCVTGFLWEMPPLYTAMDMVVLPSYREGFPVVPLEAAAMALPVIATNIPGCVDAVVDGVTGKLIKCKDAQALTDAIRNYITDKSSRLAHGQAARERVLTEFQPGDIWEATHDEYLRLLNKASHTNRVSARSL